MQKNNPYGSRLRPRVYNAPEDHGAKQSFRDECDINKLVARYSKFGFPEAPPPQYVDTTRIPEFQDAQNMSASVFQAYEDSEDFGRYPDAYSWFLSVTAPETASEAPESTNGHRKGEGTSPPESVLETLSEGDGGAEHS